MQIVEQLQIIKSEQDCMVKSQTAHGKSKGIIYKGKNVCPDNSNLFLLTVTT